jgi:hypothetical protein
MAGRLRCVCLVLDQWPAETGIFTLWKEFVPRPNAFTGLLSQIPILLSKMRLWAITVRTRVPPENTRTPVVFRSVGEAGESSVSRSGCSSRSCSR